ncbi:hypothetical protein AB0M34_32745 [Nocardia sp. NPDC050193]
MDIAIRIEAVDLSAELASLREWLIAEDQLRGVVRVVEIVPGPGKLGADLANTLIVAVGGGGAATVAVRVISTTVIAWLQRRSGEVNVKLTKHDGSTVEISATNVRDLTLAGFDSMTTELAEKLSDPSDVH